MVKLRNSWVKSSAQYKMAEHCKKNISACRTNCMQKNITFSVRESLLMASLCSLFMGKHWKLIDLVSELVLVMNASAGWGRGG